jgi:hypothetical protein
MAIRCWLLADCLWLIVFGYLLIACCPRLIADGYSLLAFGLSLIAVRQSP